MLSVIEGSRILVTGGTGSIGSEVVRRLIERGASHIVVLSRDDSKQFYMQQEFFGHNNVQWIIGDVRDRESLLRAFQRDIDHVVHAAALKHVLISEQNPTEAVKTNILGTQNVVDLARATGVKSVLMVSTDKAVNPTSTMGATKYVAEKLALDGNSLATRCACVRFGNVLGSRGSVIPAIVLNAKERGRIWVSDLDVTRFAMPIPEAAELVLDSLEMMQGGEIFVLKMKAFSLRQLVDVIAAMDIFPSGFEIDVKGLVRAEKLHEDLITSDELDRLHEGGRHYIVAPPVGNWTAGEGVHPSELKEYNSSHAGRFSDEELTKHVRDCIEALGLD